MKWLKFYQTSLKIAINGQKLLKMVKMGKEIIRFPRFHEKILTWLPIFSGKFSLQFVIIDGAAVASRIMTSDFMFLY